MNTDTHLQKTNVSNESLNKLIPFMVRPFDKLTAHHERNQQLTVRPELFDYAQESPVEGLNQRFLKNMDKHDITIGPVALSTISFRHQSQKIQTQKGVTLFTALIFMIMLSLLGVNAAQMSTLEERMSGNTRSRDLAFQAAEAALEHVEQNLAAGENIRSLFPTNPPNSTSGTVVAAGLRYINVCLPNSADYWNGSGAPDCNGTTQQYVWSSATARTPSHSLNQVASQPMYAVERLPNAADGTKRYRATARGVGGDSAAVVILQAMFSYTP